MLIRTKCITFPVLNRLIRTVTPKVVSNRVRIDLIVMLGCIKAGSWSEVGAISCFKPYWTQVLARSLSCRCLEALLNRSIIVFLHSLQIDIKLVLAHDLCQLLLWHDSLNGSFQVAHSHFSWCNVVVLKLDQLRLLVDNRVSFVFYCRLALLFEDANLGATDLGAVL